MHICLRLQKHKVNLLELMNFFFLQLVRSQLYYRLNSMSQGIQNLELNDFIDRNNLFLDHQSSLASNNCNSNSIIKLFDPSLAKSASEFPKSSTLMRKSQKMPKFEEQLIISYIEKNIFQKTDFTSASPIKSSLCSDYQKNPPVHIFSRAVRWLFKKGFQPQLIYYCEKWRVDISRFREYYLPLLDKICSLKSLVPFFSTKCTDERLVKLFDYLICKVLRKYYTLDSLGESRMKDKAAYIKIRNTRLLYFSDYIND